jgi:hypothetical protein
VVLWWFVAFYPRFRQSVLMMADLKFTILNRTTATCSKLIPFKSLSSTQSIVTDGF